MLERIVPTVTLASAALLVVLLLTTSPSSTGPLGILGFFVFMYLTALGVLAFLFRGVSVVGSKLGAKRHPGSLGVKELPFRVAYYYASVIALVPVMFIAIQSVGEVGPYQVLLVVFFIVIAWIYVQNRLI